MISSRDAGQFGELSPSFWQSMNLTADDALFFADQLWGPLLMCGAIFIALTVNFALRWNEM